MTRKDSEKDSERPHYYSQFWLDVAAGRRVIGTPKPGEEGEPAETETTEAAPQRKTARSAGASDLHESRVSGDGRGETVVHPVAEPVATPDDFIEPDADDLDLGMNEGDDLDLQNLDDADIPDMDLSEEEEEEDFFDEEEEEEDDIGWGANRGRKKPKPGRTLKQPPKKTGRRDPRRGSY